MIICPPNAKSFVPTVESTTQTSPFIARAPMLIGEGPGSISTGFFMPSVVFWEVIQSGLIFCKLLPGGDVSIFSAGVKDIPVKLMVETVTAIPVCQ